MSRIALAESTQWPDHIEDQKAFDLKRDRLLEAYEQAGLTRQVKLCKARRLFEVANFQKLVRRMFESVVKPHNGEEWWSFKVDSLSDDESVLTVGTNGFEAQVSVLERFNREIPFPVVCKLMEVKELDLFDQFKIMAPRSQWTCQQGHSDPVLLGVIDAPTENPEQAVYFVLAEWE